MRDGFFHADMHPGNLFVDDQGRIVAVDFGIMGRLGMKERRFLAEILYGFINAQLHAASPRCISRRATCRASIRWRNSPKPCAPSASRSWTGRRARSPWRSCSASCSNIPKCSTCRRGPSCCCLQKTMVVVEGVGRSLDPELNMWVVSEPVVKEWMEQTIRRRRPVRGGGGRRGLRRPLHGRHPEAARPGRAHGRSLVGHGRGGLAGSTITRWSGWPRRRPARTGRAASASGSARIALAAIALALLF